MVKVCSAIYPKKEEEKYKEYFEKFPYQLSNFQKYAIEAIVEGHHVLVTAHTGSGKTLPAEFAIEHFVSKGKKVIYTAPIKALSNQKFYEFTHKFPHISFGILTGDIKTNPEADVLIMTTEILLNTLYNKKSGAGSSSLLAFEMDLENDLGCVIFDEVHYVNDPERGRVWEESIMMLPLHVQMIMLSATIDAPEKFALWCETRGIKEPTELEPTELEPTETNNQKKIVYLASTNHRVVPLTHYSFITTNTGIFKSIKDKELEKNIRDMINKPFIIQSSKGEFNEVHYHTMRKMLELFQTKRVIVKRSHVLNEVSKYMKENNMLPALCFVLSRKQLEICAKEVTYPLLEDDSKVPYIIRHECEQIIRKLPNYEEYLHLPEYINMVTLLEKGIAIHHSGVMPVLKEMVELLYAKGYIKLLFATETFSIGVNMPTKTVLFTDVNKFDGNHMRILYSHEYTQMAGRAGRRGIDTVGNVIHLNNLFKNVDGISYKQMMQGKPQKLSSKFKVSYNLLLNLIYIGDTNFTKFTKRSMIQEEIEKETEILTIRINKIIDELEKVKETILLRNPIDIVNEYITLITNVKSAINKKRKEMERRISLLKDTYRNIDQDVQYITKYNEKQNELDDLQYQLNNIEQYLNKNIINVLDVLICEGFIQKNNTEKETDVVELTSTTPSRSTTPNPLAEWRLTTKGQIACHLREIHCLVFASLLEDKTLEKLTPKQLVGLFSCFTNVSVNEQFKIFFPLIKDIETQDIIQTVKQMYNDYEKKEEQLCLTSTGCDYNIHYDLIEYVMKWCECENVNDCKLLIQTVEREKGIFLGEFIKALLKINNISSEMEKIAENCGSIEFLSKLREIHVLTLKYVATNQSLYI